MNKLIYFLSLILCSVHLSATDGASNVFDLIHDLDVSGALDQSTVDDLQQKYSRILYDSAVQSHSRDTAYLYAWCEVLKHSLANEDGNALLVKLARMKANTGLAPSIANSAWVVLAERYDASNGAMSHLFFEDETIDRDSHGYLFALSLLADFNITEARDILIQKSEFTDYDSYDRAKLAARGLLVFGHKYDDELALEAMVEFRESYVKYIQNR